MKWFKVVLISLVCVLPTLALAEAEAPDAHALGLTEAILNYCSNADPSSAGKYQEQAKRLAHGANDETLAKVRNSDDYRKAYDSVDDFVSKVDQRNAQRVCAESIAASK